MVSDILFCLFLDFVCRKLVPVVLNIISRGHNQSVWNKLKGKTVVVSGASEDLGRELCRELVKRDVKLVLIGANETVLNLLKDELEAHASAQPIEVFPVELKEDNDFSFLDKFEDPALLINQIVCLKGPTLYLEGDEDFNISHTTKITRRVLRKMIERKFGFVLNIGSLSATIPFPYLASYAAAHAYLRTWSYSLHYEMKNFNIEVEFAELGYLASKTVEAIPFAIPTPTTMARYILDSFGSARYVLPYPPHFIQALIVSYLPDFAIGRIFEYFHRVLRVNKRHDDRRMRARQSLRGCHRQ